MVKKVVVCSLFILLASCGKNKKSSEVPVFEQETVFAAAKTTKLSNPNSHLGLWESQELQKVDKETGEDYKTSIRIYLSDDSMIFARRCVYSDGISISQAEAPIRYRRGKIFILENSGEPLKKSTNGRPCKAKITKPKSGKGLPFDPIDGVTVVPTGRKKLIFTKIGN